MAVPINNVTRRVVYSASGTGPYNFTFEILAATDISVYKDDTLLVLTTDYTVTINANGTGYVTLTASPVGATQIAIVGNRTIQRLTDFVTGGDFFANSLNDELDQQTIFAQQNAEGLGRALVAPQTDPTSINMTLPGRTARANKALTFDASGNPTTSAGAPNTLYYGTAASDPATRPDGSAKAVGDLYYNTTVGLVKIYTAAGWVNLGTGTMTYYSALATSGQTTITTNYVVGAVQVFINGSLLHPSEFTATNGTSITVSALTLNDEIVVISTNQVAYAVPVTVSTAEPSGTPTNGALWLRGGVMRNLWVYNGGAWVKPASVFGARDGDWYLVDTMSIVSDGEYKIVLDQQMITAEVVISLFSAIPGNTDDNSVYWTTLIGGRMLGDINNDGTINVLDGLYLNYYRARLFGSIPAGGRSWIEQQIIPYMTDNPPPV